MFKCPANDSGGKFALHRLKAMSWEKETRWTRDATRQQATNTHHIPVKVLHKRVLQQLNVLGGIVV